MCKECYQYPDRLFDGFGTSKRLEYHFGICYKCSKTTTCIYCLKSEKFYCKISRYEHLKWNYQNRIEYRCNNCKDICNICKQTGFCQFHMNNCDLSECNIRFCTDCDISKVG